MRLKRKINIKLYNFLLVIIVTVILLSFLFIHYYNKRISNKIISIAQIKINEYSNDIIMDSFNKQILDEHEINNIIKISKNKSDEIIAVDFDLKKAYLVSMNVSKNIRDSLNNLEKQNLKEEFLDYYQKDGFVLLLPIGLASKNIYFSNLGPRIPVRIKFVGNLTTGLQTKIKEYGVNNSLIEVYLKLSLNEEIIVPYSSKKINNSCEILLSSQVIEGIVPSIYNGLLEKNSSLINVPLNN
ncbi:MAG TPA: sporulation protein YunB [Bacilli bacterium]|jgi:sporulation protein yunB|nr:sporulation protein YunB [Bacilli bacterium]